MKVFKDTNSKFTFITYFFTCIFVSSYAIWKINSNKTFNLQQSILVVSGIIIGAFIAFVVIYYLVKKLKIRLISIFLLFLFIAISSLIGKSIFEKLLNRISSEVSSFDLSEYKYYFTLFIPILEGFLAGFISMAVFYLMIENSQTLNTVIFLFLNLFISRYLYYDKDNFWVNAILIFFFRGYLIISYLYIVEKYSILKNSLFRKKKILTIWALFFLLNILLCLSIGLSSMIRNVYRNKGEKVGNEIEKQFIDKYKQESSKPNYYSDLDLKSRKGTIQPRIVGFYKADRPHYLKTDVFRNYNRENKLWVISDGDDCYFVDNYSKSYWYDDYYYNTGGLWDTQLQNKEEIEIVYKYNNYRIVPSVESVMYVDDKYGYSASCGLIQSNETSDGIARMTYQTTVFDYDTFKEFLYEYGDLYYYYNDWVTIDKDLDRYEEIYSLAQEITKGLDTTYEKAKAIEDYFHDNYLYTFTPDIEDIDNPIDDFILDTKKGFCSYFALSMSTMLDMLEIKSRVVGGYYSSTYVESLDAYVILNTDLHAWVEVELPGYGWVNFEPTTSKCDPEFEGCQDESGSLNFSQLSEENIESVMQSIDLEVTFEDISEIEKGLSFEDYRKEWIEARRKQTSEEKEKEQEKKLDEYEKEKEETNKKIKLVVRIILIALLIIIIVCGLVFISINVYKRVKNKDYYKDLKNRKLARKLNRSVRKLIAKKFELNFVILDSNNKRFIENLRKYDFDVDALRKFFKYSDKILYSKVYNEKDVLLMRKQFDELKEYVKKN